MRSKIEVGVEYGTSPKHLREDFLYALDQAGIQMAYPHVDVTMLNSAFAPEQECPPTRVS